MTVMISVSGLDKTYVLHTQGGTRIPVFVNAQVEALAGRCLTLHGPSGAGKSTLLRCLYGNCKADAGSIHVRHGGAMVDLVTAAPRTILELRHRTLGYVSQFLRAIPRVPALEIVAEPLRQLGTPKEQALARAAELLARLRIPERLWSLAPATFSGGEQQRVNIARGFAAHHPILLLDEPTASLDARNRAVVIDMIAEAKARGTAVVGVFHDDEVREAVSDNIFEMQAGAAA